MSNNKTTFKTQIEGKEIEVAIVKPNAVVSNEAHIYYQRSWSEAVKNKCMLQKKLNDYLVEQGIWNEEKQKEYEKLIREIRDGEVALSKGKIKVSEGRDIAINKMRKARNQLQNLFAEKNTLEQNTAEGIAEQARFNFLVSKCALNNETGTPIYKDVEDYISRSEETYSFQIAVIFSHLNNNLDVDFLASLPENRFLKTWGFVDENYRLINKDGKFVNEEGKLINELGQLVNEEGKLIDNYGNLLDEEGNLLMLEEAVFYDDEGNPISPPKPKEKKEDKKPHEEVQSSVEKKPVFLVDTKDEEVDEENTPVVEQAQK